MRGGQAVWLEVVTYDACERPLSVLLLSVRAIHSTKAVSWVKQWPVTDFLGDTVIKVIPGFLCYWCIHLGL